MTSCPTCGRTVQDLQVHNAEMRERLRRFGPGWQLESKTAYTVRAVDERPDWETDLD
jgi:hypothetical protein